MKSRSSQFAIVELSLLALLISGAIVYLIYYDNSYMDFDYGFQASSALDTVFTLTTFRDIVISEDLSNSTLTEDWSEITNFLSSAFLKYELLIINDFNEKTIISSCNNYFKREYFERIVSIGNETQFEFRKIRLGVCY